MRFSVIIPAYNESRNIIQTLLSVDSYLSSKKFSYEILVIDDGSFDKTSDLVKGAENKIDNLKVLTNKKNKGKGYSVKKGMLNASGDFRLFMDADNSTSIKEIDKVAPLFEKGHDVVIGSRAIKGSIIYSDQFFLKKLVGRVGNLLIRFLVLPGIFDTQCGFKCFSGEVAREVFNQVTINDWGFDVEVLALARKYGFRIYEMPIIWDNSNNSKVGLFDYFKVLWDVFYIRKKLGKQKK